MYQQIDLGSVGAHIGTIKELTRRTDLRRVTDDEADEIKENLGDRAYPYKGFYLKRDEHGSIVELYGYHSTEPTASFFAVEPEKRRQKHEPKQ